MTDGIPKNTGNGYLLKGVSLPDSYSAFKSAVEAGTQGVDLNFNSAGWQVTGTLLSKANLLSDDTKTKLNLTQTDPTVNDALGKLASTSATATLTASAWTGTDAPYTQTVTLTGARADPCVIEIMCPETATAAQREAWRAALISGSGQAAGSITVIADGDKPEIDLPLAAIIRGDM